MEGDRLTYKAITGTAMDALAGSAELRAWCLDNYGRVPLLQNDIDPMEPPEERDCPLIGVLALGGEQGQDRKVFIRELMVRCALCDERVTEDRDESGRVVRREYMGSSMVTDMLELYIYPALRAAFNCFNYPLSTAWETVETPNLNMFQARALVAVSLDVAIGEERPYLG